MNKPVSVVINETKSAIERAVSESGLPPVVLAPIFENYTNQLLEQARQQTISESIAWSQEQQRHEQEAENETVETEDE